jgi:hypothetical protein
MKKMMFPAIMVLMAFFTGCTKIVNLANINIDIPYTTQATVPLIPGDTVGTPLPAGMVLNFPTKDVQSNSKQVLTQYNTSTSKIVSVDLKSLSIAILSPPSQNFDFLDTVQLYISAASLPERLIAYRYNVPKGLTTLVLNTADSVSLKGYFLADTMHFRVRTFITAVPASGTTLSASIVFHMIANPLD